MRKFIIILAIAIPVLCLVVYLACKYTFALMFFIWLLIYVIGALIKGE